MYLAMSPHGTDGPSPIQRAAAGIGYSTIALHHHPASACDISIRNVRTHYFLDKREDGVTAAPAKPLTKARSMALSRSEPPRSLSISATRRSNALAALMRPSSSRHVSSCRGLPCASGDELVFARLSGWQNRRQLGGSSREFPASLLPVCQGLKVGDATTTRSGPTPQPDTSHQHQRCSCPHSPRGRLRYANRLRWPRWRNG